MDSKIINWCFGSIGRDNEFVTFFFVDLFLDLHTEDVQGVAMKYFCFENSCDFFFSARWCLWRAEPLLIGRNPWHARAKTRLPTINLQKNGSLFTMRCCYHPLTKSFTIVWGFVPVNNYLLFFLGNNNPSISICKFFTLNVTHNLSFTIL